MLRSEVAHTFYYNIVLKSYEDQFQGRLVIIGKTLQNKK